MKKIAVVYWSSTGNTKEMAQYIAQGVKDTNNEVAVIEAKDFSEAQVKDYNAFAFGCPAMGSEQLEDYEFEPMFNSVKPALKNKPVVLFGSYGWGTGEWMHLWEDDCKASDIVPVADSVIVSGAPDEETIEKCKQLGNILVNAN